LPRKKRKKGDRFSLRGQLKKEAFRGGCSREDIAKRVLDELKNRNKIYDNKGRLITKKTIMMKLSGLIYDAKTRRGSSSRSWTSRSEWVEQENWCGFQYKSINDDNFLRI